MAAGTVAVNIVANTRQFTKNMRAARQELGGFGKRSLAVAKNVAKFGAGIGVAVGSAVVSQIMRVNEQLDQVAKTSRKLGIAVEELQFFQFAAERAGIQTNTLNMALQRMTRRVGQAAQGTGEAKKFLEQFGLNAKEIVHLDPAKQFELISKHIKGIGSKPEQLAAAMAFFDSEGVELVNLMAEDMGKLRGEFEQFGGAASAEAVANAEKFQDAMTNLKHVAGGVLRDFVIDVTPAAVAAVEKLGHLLNIAQGRELVGSHPRLSKAFDITGRYMQAAANSPLGRIQGGRPFFIGPDIGEMGRNMRKMATGMRDQNELTREMIRNQVIFRDQNGVVIEPPLF